MRRAGAARPGGSPSRAWQRRGAGHRAWPLYLMLAEAVTVALATPHLRVAG